MANWSNPVLTSTYTNFMNELKDRDTDLALQFDGTTSTNLATGTIRWNSTQNRWQKWNGSAWAELTTTYALTGLSTTSNASIGGTLNVCAAGNSGVNADFSPMYPAAYEDRSIVSVDRKSTRLNSSHVSESRMPSSA